MSENAHIDDLLSPYLDGELPQEEADAVEAHLAQCPRCRHELARMQEVDAAYQRLPHAPAPEALEANVLRAIQPASAGKSRWRNWAPALAVAAAVLVMLGLFLVQQPDVRHEAELARNEAQYEMLESQPARQNAVADSLAPQATELSAEEVARAEDAVSPLEAEVGEEIQQKEAADAQAPQERYMTSIAPGPQTETPAAEEETPADAGLAQSSVPAPEPIPTPEPEPEAASERFEQDNLFFEQERQVAAGARLEGVPQAEEEAPSAVAKPEEAAPERTGPPLRVRKPFPAEAPPPPVPPAPVPASPEADSVPADAEPAFGDDYDAREEPDAPLPAMRRGFGQLGAGGLGGAGAPARAVRHVGGRTFDLIGGIWREAGARIGDARTVVKGSQAYNVLAEDVEAFEEIARVGQKVLFRHEERDYLLVPPEPAEAEAEESGGP